MLFVARRLDDFVSSFTSFSFSIFIGTELVEVVEVVEVMGDPVECETDGELTVASIRICGGDLDDGKSNKGRNSRVSWVSSCMTSSLMVRSSTVAIA